MKNGREKTNFIAPSINYITDIHLHAKSNKPFSLRMMNGEDRLRPIINVRPEGNDIYNKLESLLANTNKISQLSADSIEYIKKHHCPIKVAKECLDFWEKN